MPTDTFSTTDANDGSGYYAGGATWPANSGTWNDEPGGSIWVSKTDEGVNYTQDSAFLRFDTATIDDAATITAATLKLYVVSKTDSDNYSLVGDAYDFGGEPTVAADWVETASPSIFSAVDLGSLTTSAVNNIAITDLAAVNKTGFTGIRLTLSAGTPTAANFVEFAASEHAQQEPRLEVTYDLPGLAWIRA